MKEQEAIALLRGGDWKRWTPRERAVFQLKEPRLCMPLNEFHEVVEKTLGRHVLTHELAHPSLLLAEIEGR